MRTWLSSLCFRHVPCDPMIDESLRFSEMSFSWPRFKFNTLNFVIAITCVGWEPVVEQPRANGKLPRHCNCRGFDKVQRNHRRRGFGPVPRNCDHSRSAIPSVLQTCRGLPLNCDFSRLAIHSSMLATVSKQFVKQLRSPRDNQI